jgi:plastocyanin
MYRNTLTSALVLALLAAFAAPATAGSVKGSTMFEGEKPARKRIKMDADPACAALHAKPVGTEDYLIRDTGEIVNVFVYLKGGDGKKHEAPADKAQIDQHGCQYNPHVQGLMVGQTLDIVNSDPTMHNIHCLAKVNKEFNFGQPTPGTREQVFRRAENAVQFKCDVHPWMSAYIFVMDHPFYAVSGSDGQFEIKNVPAGNYTLVAWHEKLGEVEQQITVADGDLDGVTFTFKGGEKK